MFEKLSLRWKLIGSFALVTTFATLISLFQWFSSKGVVEKFDHIVEVNLKKTVIVGKVTHDLQEANQLVLQTLVAHDSTEIASLKKELTDLEKHSYEFEKQYHDLGLAFGEEPVFKAYEEATKEYFKVAMEAISLASKEDFFTNKSEFEKYFQKNVTPAHEKIEDATGALEKNLAEATLKLSAEADESYSFANNLAVLMLVLSAIIAQAMGHFASAALSKSLSSVTDHISNATDQTSTAGSQLASVSQQLRAGSGTAAASLEETVASLEELSSMVKTNSDHAKEANALSQKSKESAEHGEREIAKLIGSMSSIASGSKKIEEIISVIDDIAFQTNLLALNAAVEAARAGEQGKGFAVVAEAVRNLAQRSAVAAKDIATLIKDNVSKSVEGAKIAEVSGVVLSDIVTSVKKVSDLNSEISTASQEQSTGIQQISQAMNELDRATQENAASSEEVASSAEIMSSQSEQLSVLVMQLRAIIDGSGKTNLKPVSAAKVMTSDHQKAVASNAGTPVKLQKAHQAAHKSVQKPNNVVPLKKPPSRKQKDLESILPLEGDSKSGRNVGKVEGF